MVKRSLYFGNPAYLSLENKLLVVKRPDDGDLPLDTPEFIRKIPIEDIGIVILDNRQITITAGITNALLENNVAVITCDQKSMPSGLLLPLSGNTVQSERFNEQVNASLPLKKQLWQQTVERKVLNQAEVLKYSTGQEARNMIVWANDVRSGDSDNIEGRAAVFYWKTIFPELPDFTRGREGSAPNNLLNYGYAILRAIVARSLVGVGLLPTLGIHHHNRYNAFCLADDIMEPYRPYVDKLVLDIMEDTGPCPQLTIDVKKRLLEIPVMDVMLDGERSPLMIATYHTASSLRKCFSGEIRKILYPEM